MEGVALNGKKDSKIQRRYGQLITDSNFLLKIQKYYEIEEDKKNLVEYRAKKKKRTKARNESD